MKMVIVSFYCLEYGRIENVELKQQKYVVETTTCMQ